MSLLEQLARPKSPFRSRCTVAKLLEQLPSEDREALTRALADPKFQGTQISRALRAEGHRVGDDSVRRHRRGDCACDAL